MNEKIGKGRERSERERKRVREGGGGGGVNGGFGRKVTSIAVHFSVS